MPQNYEVGAGVFNGGGENFVTQFLRNINTRKNQNDLAGRSNSVPALGGGLSLPQTKRHTNAYGTANQVYGLEVTPNDSKSQLE